MKTIKELYDILYPIKDYNHDYLPRVAQCRDCDSIPKVENAGQVIETEHGPAQIMHPGVLVHEGCYHQQWMTDLIRALQGHHEPQEEKLFYEVLKYVPDDAVILELGSFWAFYSLWFKKEKSKSKAYLIEPNPYKIELGQHNFLLNNFEGDFMQGYIGASHIDPSVFVDWDGKKFSVPQVSVDWYLKHKNIDKLHILQADIQDNEAELLSGMKDTLASRGVDFIFLGTHSPNYPFRKTLVDAGYVILEEFEVHESFFDDGLILACSPDVYETLDPTLFKVSKK
jgi:FkbM family methyltransferase